MSGPCKKDDSKNASDPNHLKSECETPLSLHESCRNHIFFGAGCSTKGNGVAVVVHKKHATHAEFIPVSPNLCAVNMKINNHKVCVVCVYMPHSGHCSDEHETVYTDLTDLLRLDE